MGYLSMMEFVIRVGGNGYIGDLGLWDHYHDDFGI